MTNPTKPSQNNKSVNQNTGNNGSNNNIANAAGEPGGRDINGASLTQGEVCEGKGQRTTKKGREDDDGASSSSNKKPKKRTELLDDAAKTPVARACYKCGKTFGTWMAVSGHLRWCGNPKSYSVTPRPPPPVINPIKMNIEPKVLWEQIAPRLINVARNVLAREGQPASSAVEGIDLNHSSGNNEFAKKGGICIDLNFPPPAEEDDDKN